MLISYMNFQPYRLFKNSISSNFLTDSCCLLEKLNCNQISHSGCLANIVQWPQRYVTTIFKTVKELGVDAKSNLDILKCRQDKIILRAKLCPLRAAQVQMSNLGNPFKTLCSLIFQIFFWSLGMEDFANAGAMHVVTGWILAK